MSLGLLLIVVGLAVGILLHYALGLLLVIIGVVLIVLPYLRT